MQPNLLKPIPNLLINIGASFGPLDLKPYFQNAESEKLVFQAGLAGGDMLPKGLICTPDGLLTGIPAKNTEGSYEVILSVTNADGEEKVSFNLSIKTALDAPLSSEHINQMKTKVWQALQEHLPIPELDNLFAGPVTPEEVMYLMERWAIIKIWDAFNLDPPSEKKLIQVAGVSKHYEVYDRGCYLIACPKDLYSHERTLGDGLQTAKALANEVHKRGWTLELTGYPKLTRAVWVELQHLGDTTGKRLDVINFEPTLDELNLYKLESTTRPGQDF